MRLVLTCAAISLVCACSPPSPQPQPNEMETVNATRVDDAAPEGALDSSTGNHADGNEIGNAHDAAANAAGSNGQ